MVPTQVVQVVERAYDVRESEQSWLESIRAAAERLFPGQIATQAYTFRLPIEGAFEFGRVASPPELEVWMRTLHADASPALIRRGYLSGPVTSPDPWIAGHRDDPGIQRYASSGLRVCTANGIDPSGHGCSLAIIRQHAAPLSRQERASLQRIAAHLAAARRLRGAVDPARGTDSLFEGADAILAADGALQHAEGDARSASSRLALRAAARGIDRARSRQRDASAPEEALAFWRALVEGKWSLVERFDTDGRRLFVARRNEPATRFHHALTEAERKVVALVALGHSQKLCSYELGRSESTVSKLLRSAMGKLGVRSRNELVELHGAIVGLEGRPD